MALTKTPICDFGKKAENFELNSTDNKVISLNNIKGENGTLIMFICNHCPYVKAVIEEIVQDCKKLKTNGINSLAISSNDVKNYPEDSFDNMIKFSRDHNLELQYRGRIRELKDLKPIGGSDSDLFNAMKQIAETGNGPKEQIPSMGCNIKWFNN